MASNTTEENKFADNSKKFCEICRKTEANYRCPKCQLAYCSLDCYKNENHSACSEIFYKDWVLTELKDSKCSSEVRERTLEILRRENDQNTTEEDISPQSELKSLEERMAGVDLDDYDDVWSRLTEEERKDFQVKVENDELQDVIWIWEPWWNTENPLVVDLEAEDNEDSNLPEIKTDIPQLSQLLGKTAPSPLIRYNIVNVLASYCIITLRFNGEHQDLSSEAVQSFLSICLNISENVNFESLDTAIKSPLQKAAEEKLINSANAAMIEWCASNLLLLIAKKNNAEAALSDLHRLFEGITRDSKKQMKTQAKMKFVFYLSWLRDHFSRLSHVQTDLMQIQEHARLEADIVETEDIVEKRQKVAKKQQSLIQELG